MTAALVLQAFPSFIRVPDAAIHWRWKALMAALICGVPMGVATVKPLIAGIGPRLKRRVSGFWWRTWTTKIGNTKVRWVSEMLNEILARLEALESKCGIVPPVSHKVATPFKMCQRIFDIVAEDYLFGFDLMCCHRRSGHIPEAKVIARLACKEFTGLQDKELEQLLKISSGCMEHSRLQDERYALNDTTYEVRKQKIHELIEKELKS